MQLHLLIAACMAASAAGCATDNAQPAGQAQVRSDADYRTGSRLPTYEPAGTSSVKEVSRDDWNDERRAGGHIDVYR